MVHDFRVIANDRNFENAIGLTIEDVNHFLVGDDGKLFMFEDTTYEMLYSIDLKLPKSNTRDENEIINLVGSEDGVYAAVTIGKNQIDGIEINT